MKRQQQQIPFGNDSQKSKGKGRFPSGWDSQKGKCKDESYGDGVGCRKVKSCPPTHFA